MRRLNISLPYVTLFMILFYKVMLLQKNFDMINNTIVIMTKHIPLKKFKYCLNMVGLENMKIAFIRSLLITTIVVKLGTRCGL